MKQTLLISGLMLAAFAGKAQTVVVDTVSQGAGYANNVWYSLERDQLGTQPRNNWDIAFQVFNGTTAAVLVNNFAGTPNPAMPTSNPQTFMWLYRKGDATVFGTALDTNGLSTWPKLYNSEKNWEDGALGALSGFDLGWGTYDLTTHNITGDSVYIVKTVGNKYKQLFIEKLASGVYTFKYADLDGTNVSSQSLSKSTYDKRNFGYFSIDNNTALNREPDTSGAWDMLFCQYQASDYASTVQGVTAVLLNRGVKCAEIKSKDSVTAATSDVYAGGTFTSDINAIGWDWKNLNYMTLAYDIKDSVAYYIQTRNKDVWKVIFTGFAGTSSGNYIFNKKKVYTEPVGIINTPAAQFTLAVFPNPAHAEDVNVLYSFENAVGAVRLMVTDMTGRVVVNTMLETSTQLHQYRMPVSNLKPGTYIVNLVTDKGSRTEKLSIN